MPGQLPPDQVDAVLGQGLFQRLLGLVGPCPLLASLAFLAHVFPCAVLQTLAEPPAVHPHLRAEALQALSAMMASHSKQAASHVQDVYSVAEKCVQLLSTPPRPGHPGPAFLTRVPVNHSRAVGSLDPTIALHGLKVRAIPSAWQVVGWKAPSWVSCQLLEDTSACMAAHPADEITLDAVPVPVCRCG